MSGSTLTYNGPVTLVLVPRLYPLRRIRALSRAEPHFPQLPLSCYKLLSD